MAVSLKLLIADSEPGAIAGYKQSPVWRENGFEIVGQATTRRGVEAFLQSERVDLVICRDRPPDTDAARLTAAISRMNEPPAVIVISPGNDAEKMRECFLSGASDFITELSEKSLGEALSRTAARIRSKQTRGEYRLALTEYLSGLSDGINNKVFLKTLEDLLAAKEGEIVTVRSAAEFFGFNKDYFGRLFRAETGLAFGEFYKRFRMLYAQRLLLTGRFRVREVCEMSGFATADYFSSEFRKYTGKSPSELRKRKNMSDMKGVMSEN